MKVDHFFLKYLNSSIIHSVLNVVENKIYVYYLIIYNNNNILTNFFNYYCYC